MAQDPNTLSIADIRSEIERTRVEMSHTIDAIQDRLSPRRIMHEAKHTISEATIGRATRLADRLSTAMNANPLVAAAVGVLLLAVMTRSRPRLARSLGGLAVSLAVARIGQGRTA
jgi:hypothetical protein